MRKHYTDVEFATPFTFQTALNDIFPIIPPIKLTSQETTRDRQLFCHEIEVNLCEPPGPKHACKQRVCTAKHTHIENCREDRARVKNTAF